MVKTTNNNVDYFFYSKTFLMPYKEIGGGAWSDGILGLSQFFMQ